jgi:hypothetical protein
MDKAQFDEMMAKLQAVLDAVTKPKEPPMNQEGCGEANKEEVKKLKLKVEELEKALATAKQESADLEKGAEELLSVLEKNGIELS